MKNETINSNRARRTADAQVNNKNGAAGANEAQVCSTNQTAWLPLKSRPRASPLPILAVTLAFIAISPATASITVLPTLSASAQSGHPGGLVTVSGSGYFCPTVCSYEVY